MQPNSPHEIGVIIDHGARDWQIFQQRADGTVEIALTGRWLTKNPFKTAEVIGRIVLEDEYRAVTRTLDWQPVAASPDGTWSVTLRNVPRGGLYRIETALRLDGGPVEWAQRGDAIHHLGVGDVWVIAGQSNAAGYGKSPVQDPPELGLHMFRASGEWALATHPLADSTRTQYPANREGANGSHSPFLAFARVLKRRLGYPIGLIPAALGGSPISAWLGSLDGSLFRTMLDYLRDAGGSARGMCWYQGCTDTLTPQKSSYLNCFTEFVTDLRRTLNTPDFPIVTAQINRVVNHPAGAPTNAAWDAIREAQRQAARVIPGVSIISTLDCGLADCIHNHSTANLMIGERMASMALAQVYGHDVKCLHPDLKQARSDDGHTVDLLFGNVDERLSFEVIAPRDFPFAVSDRNGGVPVTGIRLPNRDTLRLELARELTGAATVTGAPGTNPPFVVPFDICGYRPMLAFTAAIER
jgi:hypothetical protein